MPLQAPSEGTLQDPHSEAPKEGPPGFCFSNFGLAKFAVPVGIQGEPFGDHFDRDSTPAPICV